MDKDLPQSEFMTEHLKDTQKIRPSRSEFITGHLRFYDWILKFIAGWQTNLRHYAEKRCLKENKKKGILWAGGRKNHI